MTNIQQLRNFINQQRTYQEVKLKALEIDNNWRSESWTRALRDEKNIVKVPENASKKNSPIIAYLPINRIKSLRRATQAELGQSNDNTEELNITLKDILGKLRVSWDMGDKYKEIDNAIKSKNVILKNLTIKKYESQSSL